MLSTSDKSIYHNALNDVRSLGENGTQNLSSFIKGWISERRSNDEILPIYQESNKTLRTFATVLKESMRKLGVEIHRDTVFRNDVFAKAPLVRLQGWERPDLFLPLPPVERPTVRRMLIYLARDELNGTILVLPSYEMWFTPFVEHAARQSQLDLQGMQLVKVRLMSSDIGQGKIESFDKKPGMETPLALFQLSFAKGESKSEPHINLDIEIPMNRKGFQIGPDKWIELQQRWYESNNVDASNYIGDSTFATLRELDSEIGSRTLSGAIEWLESNLSSDPNFINLFGVSLETQLISIVGPLALSILMMGLISTMHHIRVIRGEARPTYENAYWGVLSPSWIARVTGVASISLIPGGMCVAIPIFAAGSVVEWTLCLLGVLMALVVFLSARRLWSDVFYGKGNGSET